jgi:hypothetical protein
MYWLVYLKLFKRKESLIKPSEQLLYMEILELNFCINSFGGEPKDDPPMCEKSTTTDFFSNDLIGIGMVVETGCFFS